MDLSLSYDYEYFNHALHGSDPAPNPKRELTLFRTTQLKVGYAFSDRLSMNAWIPYRQITAPKTANPSDPEPTRFTRRFSGLGDVIVMGYYQALKPAAIRHPSFTFGMGVRLPTGSSQPNHDWGTGISRDPVLQAGAGSLDPIMAGIATLPLGRTQFYANAVARLTTGENIHGYRFGDEYQAGIGVQQTITDWLDLSLGGNAILTGHDYDEGTQVGNTGGKWFYATPGMTLRSNLISATVSLQIPMHQDVNTAGPSSAQLASDYVFSLDLSCGFDAHRTTSSSGTDFPAFGAGGRAADIETISLGEEIDIAEHTVAGKYTIFEFYGDRCLACAAVEPRLRALVSSNPTIALRKVNIGFGESEIVQQYEIVETPTMIVFDRHGQRVLRYSGTDLNQIRSVIR